MKTGYTYICKGKTLTTQDNYHKFYILEVTDTTYLIRNMDADKIFRIGRKNFDYKYEMVEVVSITIY